MGRNILLVEPNYKNKFPPIALMKLATYHKRLGDNVVFYKGNFKEFLFEQISNKCVDKLFEIEPKVNWTIKKHLIYDFIKTKKSEYYKALELEQIPDTGILLGNWVLYYKDYYWKKLYLKEPDWDRIFITTLFTFYFDITAECINDFKQLVKPSGYVMVGGILASLQPEELEAATNIKPFVGLLNKPGMLGDKNDMIVDSLPLDYTILEETDYQYQMSNAYYGSMTKGCIRHCPFCAVPKLEPDYQEYIPLQNRLDAVNSICGEQKDLLLMDNNVMASKKFDDIIEEIIACGFGAGSSLLEPDYLAISIDNLKKDVNDRGYIRKARKLMMDFYKSIKNADTSYQIYCALEDNHLLRLETTTKDGILKAYDIIHPYYEKKLKTQRPSKRSVDFNQGVDARLFTPHIAKQFARIAINPLRIAFDNLAIKDTYVAAIEMCKKEGLSRFSNYLLYNFNDKPIDLYKRLEINILLCDSLDVDIYSFPMKYHPLFGEHSHDRNYIGKYWNIKYVRAVQAVLNVTKGCIGRGTPFFYRAFGKSEQEYMDILLMPDTMILYRFFFEWLETKKHPLSKYAWQRKLNKLSEKRRAELIDYLCEDKPKPMSEYPKYIQEMVPFYKNYRDEVGDNNGSLHALKLEFDAISKEGKDAILLKLAEDFKEEQSKQCGSRDRYLTRLPK